MEAHVTFKGLTEICWRELKAPRTTALYKQGRRMRTLSAADVIALREVRDPREQLQVEAGYMAATGISLNPDSFDEYDARELGLEICFD